jgi:hypothetical protein
MGGFLVAGASAALTFGIAAVTYAAPRTDFAQKVVEHQKAQNIAHFLAGEAGPRYVMEYGVVVSYANDSTS